VDLNARTPITVGTPSVSVVINTFNYGRLVVEAVESVCRQTFPANETEVIVVDDGSTDDTRAQLEPYGDIIRYVHKENGGQASALNVGIALARGDVIALLDADDLWRSDKLERVIAEFRRDDAVDVVSHYVDVVDADGRVVGVCPDGPVFFDPKPLAAYLAGGWPFLPPTSGIAVRSACMRRIAPIPEEFRICADLYLVAMLPFEAREFRLIEDELGSYRIHGANHWSGTSGIKRPAAMIGVLQSVFRHVEKALLERGYDPTALKQRFAALEAVHAIAVAHQEGRVIEAIRRAWDVRLPWPDERLNHVGHRTMRACAAALPPAARTWWRRRRALRWTRQNGSR
jgi:glycosyltransferase involved in cell wall biosynthesis